MEERKWEKCPDCGVYERPIMDDSGHADWTKPCRCKEREAEEAALAANKPEVKVKGRGK